MKKILLIATLAIAASAVVSAQDAPSAQWGNLFGGAPTSGDQSTAIAVAPNGNVVWLNTANTTPEAPTVAYAGTDLFTNDAKTNNLSLVCTNASGALLWQANTTTADVASNQGSLAIDARGNVIFTAKVRALQSDEMTLIDASGAATTFGGVQEKPYYRIMVAKLNGEGILQWVKLFKQSTEPAPAAAGANADFTGNAVSSTGLAVDHDGNIYVGGNYCSTMTVDGVALQPTNVNTWTGDTQTTCGNMFLVKLDSDGKYLASAIGEGEIGGASMIQNLVWDDANLYVYGYAKGNGTFSFAGTEMAPTEVTGPIVGRLNADLKADWLKCFAGEPVDGKNALQNVGLTVYGDNLWIAGQYNQKITDGTHSVAATQGSLREGFVIKLNKTDGEWLASADSRVDFPAITKLVGYFKVFQSAADMDKAYVYGYTMDATQGVFIREYDAKTLAPVVDNAWNIVTGGGVPSAVAAAYDSEANSLYLTARGNKAFTLAGQSPIETAATQSWDVLMAKFDMPKNMSGIKAIAAPVATGRIYDLQGRCVGSSSEGLAPGIYIRDNKKFIVR